MITDRHSTKKILIIIFLLSLTIRLGLGIYEYRKGEIEFTGSDQLDYISYAKNIISQGIFVPDISTFYSNSHLVGPVYPMIIALSFKIFGETFFPLIVLNAILSAFITILIYYLGKMCFNNIVGLLSSIWSIFYVPFIDKIPYVLKEVPNIFVFILLTIILIKVLKERKISYNTFILPVIFTFLIHMDERFFTYLPIFIIMFIFVNKAYWKLQVNKLLLFAGIVMILMIPWLIRNYYVYKRPVILTERAAKFTDKIFGYSDSQNETKNEKYQLRTDKAHEFTLNAFNYYMDNSEYEHKSKMDSLLLNYNLSESQTIKFGQTLSEDEKLDFAKTEIDSNTNDSIIHNIKKPVKGSQYCGKYTLRDAGLSQIKNRKVRIIIMASKMKMNILFFCFMVYFFYL